MVNCHVAAVHMRFLIWQVSSFFSQVYLEKLKLYPLCGVGPQWWASKFSLPAVSVKEKAIIVVSGIPLFSVPALQDY